MPRPDAQRILIIGGGASGALMAAHLLRRDPDGFAVTIVETRPDLGRGLAYATGNPSHRLNVRSANMSAFADDPGHFGRWLAGRAEAPSPGDDPEFRFVSRGLYGDYLESLVTGYLGAPEEHRRLNVVRDQARALTVGPDGVEVGLGSGATLRGDIAILACGHESFSAENPLYASPWAEPVGGGVPVDAPLLILGTGLTMVDTALALDEQGHRGRIVALSRRGLAPQAHRRVEPMAIDPTSAPLDRDLSVILAWLRRLAREAEAAGGDWRSVVDGLRPYTQAIWRAMPQRRRERFLQHARPWWDIHRHRMAPAVATRIAEMVSRGRLQILAGKVIDVASEGEGARVTLRRRGQCNAESLRVARIISCKGVRSDPRRSANPILESLFANGLARGDPLGIGIEVAPDCAVLDSAGRPSSRLFAIGPMSQAAFWEIVAVPDIRLQTAALAASLSARRTGRDATTACAAAG